MAEKEFLTDSGYAGEIRKNGGMTPAAEDYLEMICRLATSGEDGHTDTPRPVRIGELAEKLGMDPTVIRERSMVREGDVMPSYYN